MIEIEIDGRIVHVQQNTMIIEAADSLGIYIPRFCYHKKLSIAANCRMCLVEVEKSNKPLPACATPVTAGMKVLTVSPKAKEAQRAVMEFLLINHPLDCPICDQGGECELQDLSLGYGRSISRFTEGKRSVKDDNLGPLIATEMTRCIQCTRCVRFGQEIAGIKELGTLYRGEDLQISTYIQHSLVSELSGNIIDLCPVGALTSKPFRFTARAWELQQSPSIAPHDCLGSHIYLHTCRNKVMRTVPRENEAINETWLSDRDRYAYLGIHSEDRIAQPYIKENGRWFFVDWDTALEKVVTGFKRVLGKEGPQAMGALASPSSTTEEFYFLQKLWRGLGSSHIDHRLHQTDVSDQTEGPSYPPGLALPELEKQGFFLLVGANIQREQPLVAHRLRKAQLAGAQIGSINCCDYTFHFSQTTKIITSPQGLVQALAGVAKALADQGTSAASFVDVQMTQEYITLAKQLQSTAKASMILGAIAHNHPQAALIRQLAGWIAERCGAQCVYLTEGANSIGAWLAGAIPHRLPGAVPLATPGLSAFEMLQAQLKAYLLLNVEPSFDCANPALADQALKQADWVVALSPFKSKSLLEQAQVILPIATFAETQGSFINWAGNWQAFKPAISPIGKSQPAWQVLQTLERLFALSHYEETNLESIHRELAPFLTQATQKTMVVDLPSFDSILCSTKEINRITEWPIYAVDSLVRRSVALQGSATRDRVAVYMNSALADRLNLQMEQYVRVQQREGSAVLPVILDERIPSESVWIPAACEETSGLGESFGRVEIYAT